MIVFLYSSVFLVIANMALSAIILMLTIIVYLRIVPYVIAILSLSAFAWSIYLTGSDVLTNFFLVFFVAFLALALLGRSMARNVAQLDRENFELKDERQEILERLPELTSSELEICSFILKEKKLTEVSKLLGKSRSNITCQRTNIRIKLNMKPGDNLHQLFKKRMEN